MRRWMLAVLAALIAGPVLAHDLWLQPSSYWPAPGAAIATSVQIGHGSARERWAVDPRRIVTFRSIGPGGPVDRLAAIRATGLSRDTPVSFARPGTHVLFMESSHATSELPGIRFQEYLAEEGLTPAQQHRQRTRTTNRPGREIYSRRAKALIQVGPLRGPQPQATARLGMTLEIVPEQNPYALRPGQPLPVRVYYQNRPLAGALVKLYDLGADERPVSMRRTDAAGRATFAIPRRSGAWLVNVVWTRPITGDRRGDFDTTFSSLTFGWPPAARRQ